MSCVTCGKALNLTEKDYVARAKKRYDEQGIETYVYKLSPSSDLMIINKEYFNDVFQREIKPNLKPVDGAFYFAIQEYTGT